MNFENSLRCLQSEPDRSAKTEMKSEKKRIWLLETRFTLIPLNWLFPCWGSSILSVISGGSFMVARRFRQPTVSSLIKTSFFGSSRKLVQSPIQGEVLFVPCFWYSSSLKGLLNISHSILSFSSVLSLFRFSRWFLNLYPEEWSSQKNCFRSNFADKKTSSLNKK